jgi:hypothetical protein
VKKFPWITESAFFVVQGTEKFVPPKSAGQKPSKKNSFGFRKGTPATKVL